MSEHVRLFVSFPEELVDRPMIYEVVKRFDVVPNIRRANVEPHSGWVILELTGAQEQLDALDRVPRRGGLHRQHDGRRRHRGMTRRRPTTSSAASRLLQEASDAILAGVERELPGWVERSVHAHPRRVGARRRRRRAHGAEHDAVAAGRRRDRPASRRAPRAVRARCRGAAAGHRSRSCGARTASPLRCSPPPASRRSSATSSPSGRGPTTRYGLVIHGLGDLGDEDLAPLQMAWGHGQGEGAARPTRS